MSTKPLAGHEWNIYAKIISLKYIPVKPCKSLHVVCIALHGSCVSKYNYQSSFSLIFIQLLC